MAFRRCKARVVGRALVPIAYWEIGPYDAEKIRRALRARHISPLFAMRNTEKRQRFGTMALGHRTNLRVVEPVPSSSSAV